MARPPTRVRLRHDLLPFSSGSGIRSADIFFGSRRRRTAEKKTHANFLRDTDVSPNISAQRNPSVVKSDSKRGRVPLEVGLHNKYKKQRRKEKSGEKRQMGRQKGPCGPYRKTLLHRCCKGTGYIGNHPATGTLSRRRKDSSLRSYRPARAAHAAPPKKTLKVLPS